MQIEILYSNGSVDESVIVEFEERHGIKIPKAYRSFLQKYNGGVPQPNCFKLYDNTDASLIDAFLALSGSKHFDLHNYFTNFKDRIPNGFLPIARDPGGNLILIELNLKHHIYFWDHELEVDEGKVPTMENVYLINKSFTEFLNGLFPAETLI